MLHIDFTVFQNQVSIPQDCLDSVKSYIALAEGRCKIISSNTNTTVTNRTATVLAGKVNWPGVK